MWISAAPASEREPSTPFYQYIFYQYTVLPGGYRKGSLQLGSVQIPIGIWDLNVDGRYDDLDDLGVLVDTDFDGELCLHCVHELFGAFFFPGESLRIAGQAYQLQVPPSGTQPELTPVAQAEPFPVLFPPGNPFPELEGETIWGEQFSLAALRGKVVALFFLPQALFCSEPPAWEELCARPLEVAELTVGTEDVQVVVILTDEREPEGSRWERLRELGGTVLWAPWVRQEYRFGNGFLLLDRQGVVRYSDDILPTFLGGTGLRVKHEFVPATFVDILWAINTLLEAPED